LHEELKNLSTKPPGGGICGRRRERHGEAAPLWAVADSGSDGAAQNSSWRRSGWPQCVILEAPWRVTVGTSLAPVTGGRSRDQGLSTPPGRGKHCPASAAEHGGPEPVFPGQQLQADVSRKVRATANWRCVQTS